MRKVQDHESRLCAPFNSNPLSGFAQRGDETYSPLPLWLTQLEINDLCYPLRQFNAQIRYLKQLGIDVRSKPSGAPLVMRSKVDPAIPIAEASTTRCKPQPNRAALIQLNKGQ